MSSRQRLSLEQRLEQKLSLQHLLALRLLEIPSTDLEQFLNEELEKNPALEQAEAETSAANTEDSSSDEESSPDLSEDTLTEAGDSRGEPLEESEWLPPEMYEEETYYRTGKFGSADDEEEGPVREPVEIPSFQELVRQQIHSLSLSPEERRIAEILSGYLDEDGYLRKSLSSIRNDLVFLMGEDVSETFLQKLLKKIQNEIEPPGLFATDLREALMLQLDRLRQKTAPEEEHALRKIHLAQEILRRFFQEFLHQKWYRIYNKMENRASREELQEAIRLLQNLHPYPGRLLTETLTSEPGFSRWVRGAPRVHPDFLIRVEDGKVRGELLKTYVPRVRISKRLLSLYEQMRDHPERRNPELFQFLKKQLDRARWLVEGIYRREETLRKVIQALAELQQDFFRTGDPADLKPIRLRDIAEKTGLDISTVSRALKDKYVETPFGTFPTRYFFSEAMKTASGETVSVTSIKEQIQRMIQEEDPHHPLTDQQIADRLQEMGFPVARRTVAKYREQMGIPPARLRKKA